jgi:hypothetical protein
MKTKKKAVRFVPVLYKNAPRLNPQAFVRYIVEFETGRRNPITIPQARHLFTVLRQISHKATKAGKHQDVIIDLDISIGEWGGVETPYHRETYGMNRGKKSIADTFRGKFGVIGEGGITKERFIQEIMEIERCSLPRAQQIFHSCKNPRMNIARHCKETGLWYGCFVEELPTLASKPAAVLKRTEYRQKFGSMPPKWHDYQNKETSELLQWLVTEESARGVTISIDEADKLRHRIWNVTKEGKAWKVAEKNGTRYLIQGADYGLPEGQQTEPEKAERKVVVRPVYRTEWVENKDGDEVEIITVSGEEITAKQDELLEWMPPLEPDAAAQWLMVQLGFAFDAHRMLREQTGDLWNLVDGKYIGVSYKTEEQQEEERKAKEEKKKEEKWKETLAKVKVKSLKELVGAIEGRWNEYRRKYDTAATYHASAIRQMPPMKTGPIAHKWFGETFGLASEDDCMEAFEFARGEELIETDYNSEGRLECFRGVSVKSPIA